MIIKMKKRFIILIDFSIYSNSLLKYAHDWSKQINAELLLVHQTIVLAPALTKREIKERIAQTAKHEALQKLRELAEAVLPPNTKANYFASDIPMQWILSLFLNERFENLIFVGLKGTGLLKRIFIGSVAADLIENTNNIVVAVPKEITRFSHKKVFVDITDIHSLNILESNTFLSSIMKSASIITFFYLAKPSENTQHIEKQFKAFSILFANKLKTSFTIYNSFTDIKKEINNKIDEILIVQKGSRLLTDKFFRKFLINELVFEGQTPLIVLP